MKGNYKNWMPKKMVHGLKIGTIVLGVGALRAICHQKIKAGVGFGILTFWGMRATLQGSAMYQHFSLENESSLSWEILRMVAGSVEVEPKEMILGVGCGSGALTLYLAQKYSDSFFVGVDSWNMAGYRGMFSRNLCEVNKEREGCQNVVFQQADARELPFTSCYFDGLVSNYVYHNIPGNRRQHIKESLRCVKKGGRFAIHDVFKEKYYGNMADFIKELRQEGIAEIHYQRTDQGNPIGAKEARWLMVKESGLLYGKK